VPLSCKDKPKPEPIPAASAVTAEPAPDPSLLPAVDPPSVVVGGAEGISLSVAVKGPGVEVTLSNGGPGTVQGEFEMTPVWVSGAPWRAIEQVDGAGCAGDASAYRPIWTVGEALTPGSSTSWTWNPESDAAWYCRGHDTAHMSPPGGAYRIRLIARRHEGGVMPAIWSPAFSLPR
jgi:hypothetical protein